MQTLDQKAKTDNDVMKLFKLTHIDHLVAITVKGQLTLRLPFEGEAKDYVFVLDSVVCPKDTQTTLLAKYNGILYTIHE